jgi:hypothetical protein
MGCLLLMLLQLLFPVVHYYSIRHVAHSRNIEQEWAGAIQIRIQDKEEVRWEENGGELFFRGSWYDVLEMEQLDAGLLVWCVLDEKETNELRELAQRDNDYSAEATSQALFNANTPIECATGIQWPTLMWNIRLVHASGSCEQQTHRGHGISPHAPPDGVSDFSFAPFA